MSTANNKRGTGMSLISEIAQHAKDSTNKAETKSAAIQESGDSSETVPQQYSGYKSYMNMKVTKAKQGDKYKVNLSLSEETCQKIQYIQFSEGIDMKSYSKIPELAIDLLYHVLHKTKSIRKKRLVDLTLDDMLEILSGNKRI